MRRWVSDAARCIFRTQPDVAQTSELMFIMQWIETVAANISDEAILSIFVAKMGSSLKNG
jgi:hypothetical protein